MSADFVRYDLGQVAAGATVAVTLRQRANVRLLDAHNYARYQRDEDFRAIGGKAIKSPVMLKVPSAGHWYVILDLDGGSGPIRSSVRVLKMARSAA